MALASTPIWLMHRMVKDKVFDHVERISYALFLTPPEIGSQPLHTNVAVILLAGSWESASVVPALGIVIAFGIIIPPSLGG